MKKLTSIILFVVVLVIAYTSFWFYQAQGVKKLFINHLKEYEKPDEDGYHLKVDDVSVQGYPFNYEVKLSHPRYEKISDGQEADKKLNIAVDNSINVGTDIFGRKYWIKQVGDINYTLNLAGSDKVKNYKIKGNPEMNVEVAHPQYWKAFMNPFHGFPKVFYQKKISFQELLAEIKSASYKDQQFGLYEIDNGEMKKLLGYSKGWIEWQHYLSGNEEEKYVFNVDLKDLEAEENGKPLLPHFKKLMDLDTDLAVDVPYILGSGKNDIAFNFEANIPQNFNLMNFFNYKNLDIQLKNFEMNNLYGDTSANFDITLKEQNKNERNLHLGFNTESLISQKGTEAIHRQFIDGLRLKVAENPTDPENKVLVDLLKCCEERLQEIIPNYSNWGKMQFAFDADVKVKNVTEDVALSKIIVNHFNATTKPYGIKSHGILEFTDNESHGKYEINWINFKNMIHDLVAYYNRIYPIFEKFSKANDQTLPIALINAEKEKEIVDFFRSISDDHESDSDTITITLDFTDMNNLKIGNNSLEQVKQAWDKLVADLTVHPEPKPAEPIEEKK